MHWVLQNIYFWKIFKAVPNLSIIFKTGHFIYLFVYILRVNLSFTLFSGNFFPFFLRETDLVMLGSFKQGKKNQIEHPSSNLINKCTDYKKNSKDNPDLHRGRRMT